MLEVEKIDPKAFQSALKVLKQVNPNVTKDLRAELSIALQPYATRLASQMPEVSALVGMPSGNTKWSYKRPTGKVSLTPGSSRKNQSKLLALTLGSGNARGFYVNEMAGTRNPSGFTNRGRRMIARLNEDQPLSGKQRRGGRYAWPAFVGIFGDVQKISNAIIDRTLGKLEKEL